MRWLRHGREEELCVQSLIMDDLLPLARLGLQSRNIPDSEIDEYLDIIGSRVDSGQNGAAWQRRWVVQNGPDLHELLQSYRQCQDTGEPVHTWSL